MKPQNLLVILSDQHNRDASGCYGHPIARTPNIDRLAAGGTRFTNAYTPCPICVPARAAIATGRYVHQIGNWDNAFPYDGTPESWAHVLRRRGHRVDAIGKLHFSKAENDHGFTRTHQPLYVVEGIGDLLGCLRDDPPLRNKRDEIENAGPGDSTYLRYDVQNADRCIRWLRERAAQPDEKPWVCFLSFVCPHPPYIAPAEYFDYYAERFAGDDLPMPPQWNEADWPDHPFVAFFRRFFGMVPGFSEKEVRRLIAAYLGTCTHLDTQIGRVLDALDETGLSSSTRVIYTSDHGEHMGARGLFGKFTMYDESAAVPLILRGEGVPAGAVVDTPVSLIDLYPTILEAVGASDGAPAGAAEGVSSASASGDSAAEPGRPGESLWRIANSPSRDRTVFSEYHAVGSKNATYMLRDRRYKYVYHVGTPPQLFDLQEDPRELNDLARSAAHKAILEEFEARLRTMLDPEAVDARAKADQRAKVEAFGGRDAIIRRGSFHNSPVPGEKPAFRTYTGT